jgi:hypothetical protein
MRSSIDYFGSSHLERGSVNMYLAYSASTIALILANSISFSLELVSVLAVFVVLSVDVQ